MAEWAAAIIALQVGVIGGIWHISSQLGGIRSEQKNAREDRAHLWRHMEAHDTWHLDRLRYGKDTR